MHDQKQLDVNLNTIEMVISEIEISNHLQIVTVSSYNETELQGIQDR